MNQSSHITYVNLLFYSKQLAIIQSNDANLNVMLGIPLNVDHTALSNHRKYNALKSTDVIVTQFLCIILSLI